MVQPQENMSVLYNCGLACLTTGYEDLPIAGKHSYMIDWFSAGVIPRNV